MTVAASPMPVATLPPVYRVAPLLLGSGFCALVYQTAWLRAFRLVFGASTMASAAVLGIFMAGLGVGGFWLGKKADATDRPLRLYGILEACVALAAAASPWLIDAIRAVYISIGGTLALGDTMGTGLRLVLASVVLGLPTIAMGGTLPAVVRAVERSGDAARRDTGLLYAVNTVGAVIGVMWAAFWSLEHLGVQLTIHAAALLNGIVAGVAILLSRTIDAAATSDSRTDANELKARPKDRIDGEKAGAAATFAVVAAGLVGFVFLLMELVWYRMLAPLLGGSSYTFALILAVALVGIGIGGFVYGVGGKLRRPTLADFALTCSLEAAMVAVPWLIGDDLALLAAALRPMDGLGFWWLVGGWSVIAAIVVLPASVVAGYQFPMLIGLLGTGRDGVGEQVGRAYAANTLGAIVGSLVGGFGLIPLLSAPGVWRLVVFLLVALAAAALGLGARGRVNRSRVFAAIGSGVAAILLLSATGPTAAWRHIAVGAGRAQAQHTGQNDVERTQRDVRRDVVWEEDGLESTLGLSVADSYAFLVQGKSDGNARGDAATMIMLGLLGPLLHDNPKSAFVVGLGTGGTSGWLADVPSIERVDTVELEGAMLEVARRCAPVNRDVLSNPKSRIIVGDGREVLLTIDASYDVIISEPSNPYRAGVASLFTREFYRAAKSRMNAGGIFVQWVQSYEVDPAALRTVIGTLRAEFGHVGIWQSMIDSDLLLVASDTPVRPHRDLLHARLQTEPYKSGFARAWGTEGVEGLLTGYIAGDRFAKAVLDAQGDQLNTDDRTLVEFLFARSLGRKIKVHARDIGLLAARLGAIEAPIDGPWDRAKVSEMLTVRALAEEGPVQLPRGATGAMAQRMRARQLYQNGQMREALRTWRQQPEPGKQPRDEAMLAHLAAATGDAAAPALIDAMAQFQPVEALVYRALLADRRGNLDDAVKKMGQAMRAWQTDPWAQPVVMKGAIRWIRAAAKRYPRHLPALVQMLATQAAVASVDAMRSRTYLDLALLSQLPELCVAALATFEPNVPWDANALDGRRRCYEEANHPLAEQAADDVRAFLANEPVPLEVGIR